MKMSVISEFIMSQKFPKWLSFSSNFCDQVNHIF